MPSCLLFDIDIEDPSKQEVIKPSTPLLSATSSTNSSENSHRFDLSFMIPSFPNICGFSSYKSLAVLTGHSGSVSCLALCGEFILSGSQGKDLIVWQQPDLRQFTKFGQGDGSVKAVVSVGNRVFTAHQDMKIRVWKVSRRSENVFRLVDSLPTTKDYLGKFMKQSNYVQTRRHHKRLWIEHADSISCLAVHNGLIYSGSWDKTLKIWRISDFKCLESIKAHDDAVNGLATSNGNVYSASADGTIKVWGRNNSEFGSSSFCRCGAITTTNGSELKNKAMIAPHRQKLSRNCDPNCNNSTHSHSHSHSHSLKGILQGHKDVSLNSVVVSEDGRVVYGGGSDGFVMGWLKSKDLDSWKMITEVKAHEMAVLCMCLMMGELLCSGSADSNIGIWKREMNGGLFRVGVIKGHQGPIRCLQASHISVGGGFMLYSGSLDKSIRVWWVPSYSSALLC